MRVPIVLAGILCGLLVTGARVAVAQVPAKYRPAIRKGLDWLVQNQDRSGRWEANHGQYTVPMTGLAGMALLAEGSTVREGKHSRSIRMARDWLITQAQPTGLISNPNDASGGSRYMYSHGYGMLYLASVYGEESNVEKRRQLEDVLTRAAKFSREAQTSRGGWGYVSARDGSDFDEGNVTVAQLQALRAARSAGIKVPPEAIKDAVKYLEKSTAKDGGVLYSQACGGGLGRPALTAGALCYFVNAGEFKTPLVKTWLQYCQSRFGKLPAEFAHDDYLHYYFAQVVYALGDDRWAKLFPDSPPNERLTWSKYRETQFDRIVKLQQPDGGWNGTGLSANIGRVYATSVMLTILQLDNNCLPIYQRAAKTKPFEW